MSTNAQSRVLGRWSRTSRWCTLVHARRAFVAPADATSASCDVRSRDDSGRQRPRVAPSADRNVHGPRRDVSEPQRRAPLRQRAARRQRAATSSAATSASGAKSSSSNVRGPRRLRGVTSASRNVERRYVSERRDVSEPQRRAPLRQRAVQSHRAATSEDRDDCVA